MDELNHDFQALALEGRAMGEVSTDSELEESVCLLMRICLVWPRKD